MFFTQPFQRKNIKLIKQDCPILTTTDLYSTELQYIKSTQILINQKSQSKQIPEIKNRQIIQSLVSIDLQNERDLIAQNFQFDFQKYLTNQVYQSENLIFDKLQYYDTNLIKTKKKIQPLFKLNIQKNTLNIEINQVISNKYCKVHKSYGKQTRHLHHYIKTINKCFLKKLIDQKNFKEKQEIILIQQYFNQEASFWSTQKFFGVYKEPQKNHITVTKQSDNIRKILFQFQSSSNFLKFMYKRDINFKARLLMIKLLERIRMGIIFPQYYTKWKQISQLFLIKVSN